MKIFEKEINQVLLTQKNELTLTNKEQIATHYTPEITAFQHEINKLKQEIETNNLYNTYISEAEGTAGTKLLGKGPVYKEKREKHDAALAELQQLKIDNKTKITNKENQIVALTKQQNSQVTTTQPIIDGFDGLMARITTLVKLPWPSSFFIFLLFLAIETSPISAKLIAPKSEYDFKLQDIEDAVKTWITQKTNQREQVLKADTILNSAIYNKLAEEEEVYNYKKQKAREVMQLQADAFYKSQKEIIG